MFASEGLSKDDGGVARGTIFKDIRPGVGIITGDFVKESFGGGGGGYRKNDSSAMWFLVYLGHLYMGLFIGLHSQFTKSQFFGRGRYKVRESLRQKKEVHLYVCTMCLGKKNGPCPDGKRQGERTRVCNRVSISGNRFGKIVRRVMVYWPQEDSHERNILSGADDP